MADTEVNAGLMDPGAVVQWVSVLMGWLLGVGTTLISDAFKGRKLRAGLLEELQDLQTQSHHLSIRLARWLQVFAKGGCDPAVSIPLQNLFFKEYYKDVMQDLNRDQRMSYQLVHSSIDQLNQQLTQLYDRVQACMKASGQSDQTILRSAINAWGEAVVAAFKNARQLQWHLAHHIANSRRPKLDIGAKPHAGFLRFLQGIDKEVHEIFESARTLEQAAFEEKYDEKAFADLLRVTR